jgi:hypothetical protein
LRRRFQCSKQASQHHVISLNARAPAILVDCYCQLNPRPSPTFDNTTRKPRPLTSTTGHRLGTVALVFCETLLPLEATILASASWLPTSTQSPRLRDPTLQATLQARCPARTRHQLHAALHRSTPCLLRRYPLHRPVARYQHPHNMEASTATVTVTHSRL